MSRTLACLAVASPDALEVGDSRSQHTVDFSVPGLEPEPVLLAFNMEPQTGTGEGLYHKLSIPKEGGIIDEYSPAPTDRLIWALFPDTDLGGSGDTRSVEFSCRNLHVREIVLFHKKEAPSGESLTSFLNYVVKDESQTVETKHPSATFKLAPLRSVVADSDKWAVLGFRANPGNLTNMPLVVYVNDEEIGEFDLSTAPTRNFLKCFTAAALHGGAENEVRFEARAGAGEIAISNLVLWYPHNVPRKGHAMDYLVIKDGAEELDAARAPMEFTEHFELPADTHIGRHAILGCQVEPRGASGLTYRVHVNGTLVYSGSYSTEQERVRWSLIDAALLKPGEDNEVEYSVEGGAGILAVSDVVLFYKRDQREPR